MELSPDEFLCNICLMPLEDPMNDPCGHSFCKDCITTWHKTTANCPVSKMYFGSERLNPNRLVKLMLEKHGCKCQNVVTGCSWHGKFADYEREHRANCVMMGFPQKTLKAFLEMVTNPSAKIHRIKIGEKELTGIKNESEKSFPGMISHENGDLYEGMLENDLRHGPGRFHSTADKTTTECLWANDLKNGYGCIFKDGMVVFQGTFSEDFPHGPAIIQVESGTVKLNYVMGVVEGEAEIKFKTGEEYNGMISQEFVPHGKGMMHLSDGTQIIGDFKDGHPNEEIEMIFLNGDNFKGKFKEGTKAYVGEMKYNNKEVYVGELVDRKREGEGKLTFTNGDVYEGNFTSNNRAGDGKYTWVDGTFFVGKFENNYPVGRGTKTTNKGVVIIGNTDCYFHIGGPGSVRLPDGTLFEGPTINGETVSGMGKITLPNGDVITGKIENKKIHGPGEIKFANGNSYKGLLKNSLPDKKGVLVVPDEGIYIGEFVNGLMHGRIEFKERDKKTEFINFRMGKKEEFKKPDSAKVQKPSTAKLLDSKDQHPTPKTTPRPKTEHKEIKKERAVTEPSGGAKNKLPPKPPANRWA